MTKNNIYSKKNNSLKDNSIPLPPTQQQKKMNLISIDDIFEKYTFIKTEMNWRVSDIELFYESHLILGVQKEDNLYIDTTTFEMLIKYHRDINNKTN